MALNQIQVKFTALKLKVPISTPFLPTWISKHLRNGAGTYVRQRDLAKQKMKLDVCELALIRLVMAYYARDIQVYVLYVVRKIR